MTEIKKKGNCQCNEYATYSCKLYGKINLKNCVGCIDSKSPSTLDQVAIFLEAMIKHKLVSAKEVAERQTACKTCVYNEKEHCTLCSCLIIRLSQHEENLPKWGCKHPERGRLGWPI